MNITSKQRAYLRSLAHSLNPIFQIGKSGISDNQLQGISEALEAHELIKITVLETAPDSIKILSEEIANATSSLVVQTMGNKITLFRKRSKNSKIELPK